MQAEACFKEYLKQSKEFDLLAANLQIQGEKETLGELDFIVKNLKTGENIHIELACKFYLFHENKSKEVEQNWVGPNRKDSLSEKLEKLKLKQFPLLKASETIQKLNELRIEKPTSQAVCLKAFLFIPKYLKPESFPKNYEDCIVGHYVKATDFVKEESALYAIPTKKEWILPVNALKNWYTFLEIKPLVDEQLKLNKSPLIYKKTPHKLECFFVVWW